MHLARALSVILFCALSVASSVAERAGKKVNIEGYVVAFSSLPVCLNGNAYWSAMVRVAQPETTAAQFLLIEFSLPCDMTPKWLKAEGVQRFRLTRSKEDDSVLKEYLGCVNVDDRREQPACIPMWTYVSEGAKSQLPFGQVVPAFHSADFPPKPGL